MKRESYAQALQSLGLAGPYAELEAIQAEEAALARRKKRAQRMMLAALRGVPLDEVSDQINVRYGGELPLPIEAAEALSKRQAAHQEQLLGDDPIGREIARLETERDGLLDTIWLATSPAQIRTLWSKVASFWATSRRGWSARRWRSNRARRRDAAALSATDGGAGPAGGRRIVTPARAARPGPRASPRRSTRWSMTCSCRGSAAPRKAFFNQVSGWIVLPFALGGAALGYQGLGVLGLILGLGAGLTAGCSFVEKQRFFRR